MTQRHLVDVDIAARADGKLPAWDDGSNTHVYVDPSAAGALSSEEDVLASLVALGTTAYADDLLSLELEAGTYLVLWKIACTSSATPTTVYGVVWTDDEVTKFDEDESTLTTNGFRWSGPHGWAIVELGSTTTIKLSASRSSDGAASALRDGGNSDSHRLTKLTAIKIG